MSGKLSEKGHKEQEYRRGSMRPREATGRSRESRNRWEEKAESHWGAQDIGDWCRHESRDIHENYSRPKNNMVDAEEESDLGGTCPLSLSD